MKRHNVLNDSLKIFFSALLFLFFPVVLSAGEPVLLNFEQREKNIYTRFESAGDSALIRRWALNRNLSVLPDSPPFSDKNAHFVSRLGSSVAIGSLDPNAQYTLFIDFVSYEKGNGGIVSRLDILCDGEKLAELRFGEQRPPVYSLPIPRNHTIDGAVTISFEEYAVTRGVWGIWDMILSDGSLPEKIQYVKEVPVIKDSSGEAPDVRGGKKDKSQKNTDSSKSEAKPEPKPMKEPKDVIIPETKDVNDVKKPGSAKIDPPKLPAAPDVQDVKVKEKGKDIRE